MNAHILTDAELDESPWAACGPTALAGLLERPLAELRDAFPDNTPRSIWTNVSRMLGALHHLGVKWTMVPPGGGDGAGGGAPSHGTEHAWPQRGLVSIQFRGGWDGMPVNHAAQLRRSHWIAVRPMLAGRLPFVFDGNAIGVERLTDLHWWQPRKMWEHVMVPLLVENLGKRATGHWWVRAAIEVEVLP